ncbi:hypothetical protein A2533_04040 [Candidatus Falkowbacteria bacterium RIFOXYD2_FULL_35_9]|uniref:Uncharacterized protein n=1 Tax=Candidatus Falkowbacteria bacterium RIFOXYC2_FULL_36_12 TaxID=1798002 RepID=A0A1F5SYB0_9BACT|nr:MAG: hypothetical protein A2478_04035 [Candidatus Falkowbacteria bacterium RIFOXYC2_FULL_36_12]OGF46697.1 MAG: hypothetical protein A2533_04040 [Candidatus Falkowbacteria bacterium RIFOXYD2_FULL_35_9]
MYVLVLIVAMKYIGLIVLLPGFGIPLIFYFVDVIKPQIKQNNDNRGYANRLEMIEIAEVSRVNDQTQEKAELLLIKMGAKFKPNQVGLPITVFQLSNRYLGKLLAHLMLRDYPTGVYKAIADSLLQHRRNGLKEVLESIHELNPSAEEKLKVIIT